MDEDLALSNIRNLFYVGDYRKLTEEVKSLCESDAERGQMGMFYLYRAFTEMKQYDKVLKSIDKLVALPLQVLKLYVIYLKGVDEKKRDEIFGTLSDWVSDSTMSSDPLFLLIAAQIYYAHGDRKEALKLLLSAPNSLEIKGFTIQVLLEMNRLDLAQKTYTQMLEIDDDASITLICSAWLSFFQGGDKIKEGFDLLQDLVDRYGPTVKINNLMAASLMHQENFQNAFEQLKGARDLALQNKERVSAETLINTIVCLQHLGKPDNIIEKIVGELKKNHPNHSYFQKEKEIIDTCQRLKKNYK